MSKIFQLFALFAAVALLSGVSAGEYTEEENVLVLGDSSLQNALQEFEYVLVEFYAPWCGHCKKLAPEYARAATALKEEGSNIRLAKVDCTVEKETGEKYEVRGYPTLKFFINGQPIDYEGGRVEKDIINWVKRKTQPSTREVTSAEELTKETKSNDVVVVFFGGKDAEGYSVFETVSRGFDDVAFVYTTNTDIRGEQKVPDGTTALLLKNFDEGRNEFVGALNAQDLKNFIEGHRYPLVLPFDQKAAQKIFGENIPTVFLIYQKNEDGQRSEAVFKEAAQKLKGKIQFSLSDINDGALGPRLAEFVGVKDTDTPAIRIVVPQRSAAPKKYLFNKETTVENLVQFYEDFNGNNLKPFLKSEPVPASNDEPVKIVVGENFDQIVLDTNKDVFIEFYAPWCGHCKKLSPIWDELAQTLSSISNLVIAKMDSTANEVESVNVSGFPTLKFYPANNKQDPITYDGERTKEGFLAWLKEKITVQHDASAFGDAPAGNEL